MNRKTRKMKMDEKSMKRRMKMKEDDENDMDELNRTRKKER